MYMLIPTGADEFKTNQHGLTCYEGIRICYIHTLCTHYNVLS